MWISNISQTSRYNLNSREENKELKDGVTKWGLSLDLGKEGGPLLGRK